MKHLIVIILAAIALLACDNKKTSIGGTVVNKITGDAVANVLVSYVQCQENGDNCTEVIIGQMYTLQDGSFKIEQRRASKSKTRWVAVYGTNRKIGQMDNVGLTDKNIIIEVTP